MAGKHWLIAKSHIWTNGCGLRPMHAVESFMWLTSPAPFGLTCKLASTNAVGVSKLIYDVID